jgi:hypothetical protein
LLENRLVKPISSSGAQWALYKSEGSCRVNGHSRIGSI